MKKIVLFTAVLAFIASSSFAVTLFIDNGSAIEGPKIEMTSDQGEKTKSKEAKKETKAETTTETTEKKSTSSSKKSCKKSCEKSCKDKGSK